MISISLIMLLFAYLVYFTEVYLGPCQTSMIELKAFSHNSFSQKNTPSLMSDRALNAALEDYYKKKKGIINWSSIHFPVALIG